MIALNVLYAKKEKINPAYYFSKHNSKHEKQVILLMIPIREGWGCLALKKIYSIVNRNNFFKA